MIDIETLGNDYTLNVDQVEGDVWLEFSFYDIPGTLRKASISAAALRQLSEALNEAQQGIVEHLAPKGRTTSLKLSLGPTRGESYDSEVSP